MVVTHLEATARPPRIGGEPRGRCAARPAPADGFLAVHPPRPILIRPCSPDCRARTLAWCIHARRHRYTLILTDTLLTDERRPCLSDGSPLPAGRSCGRRLSFMPSTALRERTLLICADELSRPVESSRLSGATSGRELLGGAQMAPEEGRRGGKSAWNVCVRGEENHLEGSRFCKKSKLFSGRA